MLFGLGLLILVGLTFVVLNNPGSARREDDLGEYLAAVPMQVNFPAPELTLTDLNGNLVSLSDYLGQVVLVNNWAFWCTPCRAVLPELQEYYEDLSKEGFTVIGIEAGGEKEDVLYHVDLYRLEFPIWLDPETSSLRAFRNTGLPNSYLVDRQGTVRLTWNGPIHRELLDRYVTPIIKE